MAIFSTKLEEAGDYSVRVSYPKNDNRASNIKVVVSHAGGETSVILNQRKVGSDDPFHDVGTFSFEGRSTASVTISNAGSDGYVVIDAVQWLAE
jgi:hypothetical protein